MSIYVGSCLDGPHAFKRLESNMAIVLVPIVRARSPISGPEMKVDCTFGTYVFRERDGLWHWREPAGAGRGEASA